MDNIYSGNYNSLQYKDENFDFTNARTTAGALPDLVVLNGSSIEVAAFNGNALTEGVSATKELNHDYAEGTDIYFHTHWMPTTTTSGNVRWAIDYYIDHPDFPATVVSGTLSVVSPSSRVAWDIKTTHFPSINLGVLAKIGAQISFRFYRNPTHSDDTYPDDACITTMGWHYLTNSRGSSQLTSK